MINFPGKKFSQNFSPTFGFPLKRVNKFGTYALDLNLSNFLLAIIETLRQQEE